MMQRPGYNPSMPGMPMHSGFNAGPPGFGGPNPGFRPGLPAAGPCFNGPPAPQPMQQQGAGCFMPAATIRKISNTTNPAPFFNQQ